MRELSVQMWSWAPGGCCFGEDPCRQWIKNCFKEIRHKMETRSEGSSKGSSSWEDFPFESRKTSSHACFLACLQFINSHSQCERHGDIWACKFHSEIRKCSSNFAFFQTSIADLFLNDVTGNTFLYRPLSKRLSEESIPRNAIMKISARILEQISDPQFVNVSWHSVICLTVDSSK